MVANPSIQTAVKTAVFKLHNPSRRKRAMLDYALRQNHLAYTKALAVIGPQLPELVASEYEQRRRDDAEGADARERRKRIRQRKIEREKRLAQQIGRIVKALPVPIAAKAYRSVAGNIIGQVESHIELHDEQASVGVPTVQRLRPDPSEHVAALRALAEAMTVEEETAARDRLAAEARAGRLRPMLFAKNNPTDGFLLLKSPNDEQYFIYLNLVPKSSRFARLTSAEQTERSCRSIVELVDMRTGELRTFKSQTGALFSVEFGRDFQAEAFLGSGSPLSAKLVKSNDRYEVHIAFEFQVSKVATEARLGVDRGIYNLASLAVIDEEGRALASENVDGRRLRFVQKKLERKQRDVQRRGRRFSGAAKRFAADEAVHVAANKIVEIALKHRAQVTMENLRQLTSRGKPRGRSAFNRVLNRSQYQKLQNVLAYKLAVAGLPRITTVSAAFTSQTCPRCGYADKANRVKRPDGDGFKVDTFHCVSCGHRDDADLNAARIIALKRAWREALPAGLREKPAAELPANKRFDEFLRIHAERRGEGACGRKAGTFGRPGLDGHEDGEVPPGVVVSNDDTPLSLNPDRTSRQGQNSPTMQSAVSSSSEILPSPEPTSRGAPDG